MPDINGLGTPKAIPADTDKLPIQQPDGLTLPITIGSLLAETRTSIAQAIASIPASSNDKIPLTQKAAAGGVATLDATGQIPTTQLGGAVVFATEKGVAGGIATLDSTGKVPTNQLSATGGGGLVWSTPVFFPLTSATNWRRVTGLVVGSSATTATITANGIASGLINFDLNAIADPYNFAIEAEVSASGLLKDDLFGIGVAQFNNNPPSWSSGGSVYGGRGAAIKYLQPSTSLVYQAGLGFNYQMDTGGTLQWSSSNADNNITFVPNTFYKLKAIGINRFIYIYLADNLVGIFDNANTLNYSARVSGSISPLGVFFKASMSALTGTRVISIKNAKASFAALPVLPF